MDSFEDALAVLDDEGKLEIFSDESLEAFMKWAYDVKGRNLTKTQIYAGYYEVYPEEE